MLTGKSYQALAEFRHRIRRFLHFSEQAARAAGLEPSQDQLLLALKGLPHGLDANVGVLAERLQVRHHTAVELLNRLEDRGLVRRERDKEDRRQVHVSLTRKGEEILDRLSLDHREELKGAAPALAAALGAVLDGINRQEARTSVTEPKERT